MIIPFTASIARDSFNLTPSVVKESAYAVGATQWEVVKNVVFPYSKLGVFGGVVLSLGRALGETMAVAFVLGNSHRIATSFFDAAATITVTLANEFTEADSDIYLSSLFYLALVLFALSFITLAMAKLFLIRAERKYSEVKELRISRMRNAGNFGIRRADSTVLCVSAVKDRAVQSAI